MQEVTLEPKNRVHARFTEGIIQGEKSITVSEDGGLTVLSARWDIVLTGMMGVFSGMIKKHIQSGTEQALRSIKEVAER